MRAYRIPEVAIRRLVLYLRALDAMDVAEKGGLVSSYELAEEAGVGAAQVRKDLSLFGEFGKQGVGYEIETLKAELRRVLHVDEDVNVALVGAGSLGMALARYNMARAAQDQDYRIRVVAIFDTDPEKIGKRVGKVEIFPTSQLPERARALDIRMAILSVPARAAQEVLDACARAGVKCVLNFAPTKLVVPPGVRLHNADVSLELAYLAYYLTRPSGGGEASGAWGGAV